MNSHNHNMAPPPAAAPPLSGPSSQQQYNMNNNNNGGIPPHLFGLMTNPALAAAAAASPLFPPAAMLSNPGAFLNMPEAYQQGVQGGGGGGNSGNNNANMNNNSNNSLAPSAQIYQNFQSSMANSNNALPPPTAIAPMMYNNALPGGGNGGNTGSDDTSGRFGVAMNSRELTAAERAQQNRDRNREHARSTRLRKKAYVLKLKELVEGLHAERTEEVRQRRVAIQHLAEMQTVRRRVTLQFLSHLANYETDERKWNMLLEEDTFWLKQPVTPYRSFRRAEIEQECRMSRSIAAVIADAASMAVMMEGLGSRSARWAAVKRQEFVALQEQHQRQHHRQHTTTPSCLVRQESRLHHAVSSLSFTTTSCSSKEGGSSDDMEHARKSTKKRDRRLLDAPTSVAPRAQVVAGVNTAGNAGASADEAKKVSSSSGGSSADSGNHRDKSKDYHDYHAKPLPDPKLEDSSERDCRSMDGSQPSAAEGDDEDEDDDMKRVSTDSSSENNDDGNVIMPPAAKRRKTDEKKAEASAAAAAAAASAGQAAAAITNQDASSLAPATSSSSQSAGSAAAAAAAFSTSPFGPLPPNIAKKGGIAHNAQPHGNGNARLNTAPAISLPPFAGIGKKPSSAGDAAAAPSLMTGSSNSGGAAAAATAVNGNAFSSSGSVGGGSLSYSFPGPAVVTADNDTSSSSASLQQGPQIKGTYHVNEDDMILMDDILMCPFVFRSQDAVHCGALAECVMPGMLRAHFSSRNKLASVELVYDAMGFMQQLERASGNEGTAQIIPGSLEMALAPTHVEARVITMAQPPYYIVNVNELWTKTTGYTQMEAEGKEYLRLIEGEHTLPEAKERPCKPVHKLEEVARGRAACSTNIHYDREGQDFIEFCCSYPLVNANDEITHLLHVSKELPSCFGPGGGGGAAPGTSLFVGKSV